MSASIESLKQVPLFQNLPEKHLKRLADENQILKSAGETEPNSYGKWVTETF